MNFYEHELRRLFSYRTEFANAKYIGRACITPLDEELKVKAEFVTCGTMDRYEALKLTVINRTDGVVDQISLHFSDYFTSKVNASGTAPYICTYRGMTEWYGKPSQSDLNSLAESVCEYVRAYGQQEQHNLTM